MFILHKLYKIVRNTISSYERGNSQPDFEIIEKILTICNYEIKILDKHTNNIYSIDELSREK